MPLFYLLFAVYVVAGCYLVTRISFIQRSGLTNQMIIGLFLIKIMAGMVLGWVSNYYSYNNDYWVLNRDGLVEYNLMLHEPHTFFTNIFHSPYDNAYGGFFNSVGSYWNDLKNNIILKLLAFCDIFSRGNYYINSLFFNFAGFFGHIALYRLFIHLYPGKKWLVIAGCFLLPSTLYFSSGIHKDLVVFTMLGLYCYSLYFSIEQTFTRNRILLLCLSAIAILLTRNFLVVALLPATAAYVISSRRNLSAPAIFTGLYASGILVLLVLQLALPSFQPLKVITQKQRDFLDLPAAASQLPVNILEPSLQSFAENLPQAINHSFFRPTVWEQAGKFSLLLAVELLAYHALLLLLLFRPEPNRLLNHPFVLFAIFFTLFMILVTGYIIPNSSSIIRYKSIYLPMLITPVLCSIRWKKAAN